MFDYFYGAQSEQFAFYRVPKVLFTNDQFKFLSAEAKTLYGILLDRVPLSAKNGWIDEQGRVYIICTIEEIMADMNCGNKKAVWLLADLETKVGLIERKRQGLGKPNLIYVKNFISVDNPVERHFLKCQNETSGSVERTSLEVSKGHGTNTDMNHTEYSDTDSILPSGSDRRMDGKDTYQKYYDYFSEHLNISQLEKDYPYDTDLLDNILDLIVETVCSKKPMIRMRSNTENTFQSEERRKRDSFACPLWRMDIPKPLSGRISLASGNTSLRQNSALAQTPAPSILSSISRASCSRKVSDISAGLLSTI